MIVNKTLKAIVLLAAISAVAFVQSHATRAQKPETKTRSTMRWEQSDNGERIRVEFEGKAEFNDEYSDIRDVSEGGYVRIEEERAGQSRRYEVRKNLSGQLERTYYLNGAARPIDQETRAWIGKLVLSAVRQSGIDADKRLQSIMRQRGVSGAFEEIALVGGSYAKRLYFQALLKTGSLKDADLQRVLREAAHQITSDYEQAQLLIAVSPELANKDSAMPAFFEATATIKSDYEHRRVLTALVKNNALSHQALLQTARSAARISSDYEKATVLKAVAEVYLIDRELSNVFFETVDTVGSDYEHRGVLSTLIKKTKLNDDVLARVLSSASRISSDYEKATLLVEASNSYAGDGRMREAFLQAAGTIKSDYERGRVLSALMKNKQIS
jgi:uncharacterized protein YeeX (DUF496 family)